MVFLALLRVAMEIPRPLGNVDYLMAFEETMAMTHRRVLIPIEMSPRLGF